VARGQLRECCVALQRIQRDAGLNFDAWFLRERFMAAAPLKRHCCRYDRAASYRYGNYGNYGNYGYYVILSIWFIYYIVTRIAS